MKFLEARRLVAEFRGGPERAFLFGMSGTADPIDLYLRAAGALRGVEAKPSYLPFGTLAQTLLAPPQGGDEVFLLLPWDLVPEADWRSGVPADRAELADLRARAERILGLLAGRPRARLLYLPAASPPLTASPLEDDRLALWLRGRLAECGAREVPADAFSLAGYLASGCPVGGSGLGLVAQTAIDALLSSPPGPIRVIVTDLDNVVWGGVIGEDGLDGIVCGPEGKGYRHWMYQTALIRWRRQGVLVAAVSRNDAEIARAPFEAGRTAIQHDDLVALLATYQAKSAQIRSLAEQLNLGLDAFLFIDDNPIELEEVRRALPEVRCLAFPPGDEGLPALLREVEALCQRPSLTAEDRERTDLYRRRLAGMAPAEAAGADLTGFLRELDMRLVIHDRSQGDRARAVQLINKTNQFNLNGVRVSDDEVAELLACGAKLWGASLHDRTGSHGEVLACLVRPDGVVHSWVMSCRVFQRRVEHAFLCWLASRPDPPAAFDHAETPRNEPMRAFLRDPAFEDSDVPGLRRFDASAFRAAHRDVLDLFQIEPRPDA